MRSSWKPYLLLLGGALVAPGLHGCVESAQDEQDAHSDVDSGVAGEDSVSDEDGEIVESEDVEVSSDPGECVVDCFCSVECRDGIITAYGPRAGWNGPCGQEPQCPEPNVVRCAWGCGTLPEREDCLVSEMRSEQVIELYCAPEPPPACAALRGPGPVQRDVAYGASPRQILDIHLPESLEDATIPPLFVWIHGGGWRGGSYSSVPAPVLALLQRGVAVASIEYQLSDTAFPTTISDTREAVRWLQASGDTYGYDGERLAVGGSSAGGHLAAMLGVAADVEELDLLPGLAQPRVAVVIDFFGPSELLEMDGDAAANGCGEGALCHDCEGSPEALLVDCESTLSTCADAAVLASPVTHVSADDSPFVILHGDDDCTVATPQGVRLHDALVAAGVESTLYITEGAGHAVGDVGDAGAWALVYATLERELLGCEREGGEEVVPDGLSECAVDACPTEAAACSGSEECIDLDDCISECLGTMGCIQGCVAGVSSAGVTTHRALFDCADAAGCYGR